MEKRRVQCTGGSSFSITLPKKWVEAHRIREKDSVTVLVRGTGSLIVQPPSEGVSVRRSISIDGLTEEEIRREIIALYIAGVEEAEITGRTVTKEARLAVRGSTEMVMGFEVIEESSRSIIVRNMISPEKFSFRNGIERMFSTTRSMFQDAIGAFAAQERTIAQDVIERDFDVDKLYFLILRHNHTLLQERISEEQMGVSLSAARYYAHIAVQLERIADHSVKVSQVVIENHPKLTPRLVRLLQALPRSLLPLLDEAAEFTRTVDKKRAHRILNTIQKSAGDIRPLYDEVIRHGLAGAVIVADSMDRFRGYIANMAEATIDHSFIEPGRGAESACYGVPLLIHSEYVKQISEDQHGCRAAPLWGHPPSCAR
ncbi:MAG: hypothetical protein A2Z34_00370 [Planctomycetes bacterium RBG_16_59_8]|nr:MAG: hypothetical protein A2Z34_00370 [Planctomycetes bacterium RBG_16_59_8]